MRILLLNQFFWPDNAATSQLLTDLARALAAEGHQVTAICAEGGSYAAGEASDGTTPFQIKRVKSLPFVRGRFGRILSYATFYLSAALRGISLPKQDIVVTLTTPPLLSLLGTLLKKIRGSSHFIWEMDMYPDVAVALHYIKEGGIADHLIGRLADLSRSKADGVIALGECMKERLVNRGVDAKKIYVVNNWADSKAVIPITRAGDRDKLVILYSGNLGLAHDLGTIMEGARELQDDRCFQFIFIGSGGRYDDLTNFIEQNGINCVERRPYVQRESLSQSLAAGDIGLVTQQEACCGSVVPSKVYGLLAAGRPILFIGPERATPARIIDQFGCGWHISVGDVSHLVQTLRHLVLHPEEIVDAGVNARKALLDHYDMHHGTSHIMNIFDTHLHRKNRLPVSTELVSAQSRNGR